MIRTTHTILAFLATATLAQAQPSASGINRDDRLFELRTYHVAEGRLEELNARFRDHYVKLFEVNGITSFGYWVPVDDGDSRVVFLLAYPNAAARERSWANMVVDPQWRKVRRDSERNGRLVERIDEVMLTPTELSPALTPARSEQPRSFELKTYTLKAGDTARIAKVHDKHRDVLVGSWTAVGGNSSETTLVYLLAHARTEPAKLTPDGPHGDRFHISAVKPVANVRTRPVTTDGAKTLLLQPTDYSPLR